LRPIPADAADSSSVGVELVNRKWRTLIIVCVAIFMLLLDITVGARRVALPQAD
jgi:hypothetical protein